MNFSHLLLEKARYDQAQAISDLINLTYRGPLGWTTEASLIQGDRTNHQEIEAALTNPAAHFFVINQPTLLAACIYVAKEQEHAYIGFFSIHPNLQGKGLGKHILEQVEKFAQQTLGVNKFVMFVVSQRHELISFYQRRGYCRTGKIEAFPPNLGMPKAPGLTIDYLEKII